MRKSLEEVTLFIEDLTLFPSSDSPLSVDLNENDVVEIHF